MTNKEYTLSCRACKKEMHESKLHLHHIIPKSIGGTDKDGRKYLCQKCHTILHFNLLRIVWPYIPDKIRAKLAIKAFTEDYVSRKSSE